MKKLFRSDDGKFEHEDEAKVRAYEEALTPFSHFGLPLSSHDNQRIIKASHVGLSPQDTLVVMHTFNLVEDIYRFVKQSGGLHLLQRLDDAAHARVVANTGGRR